MCPDDDEQLRAFRACPVLKAEAFQAWLLDVMWAACALADTRCVLGMGFAGAADCVLRIDS